MRNVDEKIASYLDLPFAEGIVVVDVVKDSPSDKIGLKKYDIIKKVNGKNATKSSEIQKKVSEMKPGDEIYFEIFRNGKNVNIKGKLGEKPQTTD